MPFSEASGADVVEVERAAVDWLRAELEDPDITAADNFLDAGGHSLAFSKLNAFLGDTFGLVLDMRLTYEESLSKAISHLRPVDRAASTSTR